jgi:putative ABC transport system permease protein
MNLKDPIGTIVRFHGVARQVIGVVKDFHFESLHEAIKPSFMHLLNAEGTIVARIRKEN